MAFTVAQLAAEISNDPTGRGYAALVTDGSDQSIADVLNSTYAGVGTVWRKSLTAGEILGSLVASEVSAWTQLKWTAFTTLISTSTVDATNANIRALFQTLLTGATTSLNNVTAKAQVTAPTRAEELWGEGTVVSAHDVAVALGRNG